MIKLNRNYYTWPLALLPVTLWGQADSPMVTLSNGLGNVGYEQVLTYSGSNLTYRCLAASIQNPTTLTVSSISNANPAVVTVTGHGFDVESVTTVTPSVQLSGATGGWAGVNGVWTATPTTANAFTIAIDSTGFGSFSGQTIKMTTLAPRTNATVWAIEKYVYDSSSNLIWAGWATPTTSTGPLQGGSPSYIFACANMTSYSYQ